MTDEADAGYGGGGWTGALRRRAVRALPPEKLLPDRQPAYVSSWIYVFGVLTIAALLGCWSPARWLAVAGPTWWHSSSIGHFVNSLHLWSTELFFFFMVIHLWGKFFMAAWRGRRALTWITGVVAFVGSIGTAFTGYLVQQNFDSQWIATEAKDGLNSVGVGAWFNVLEHRPDAPLARPAAATGARGSGAAARAAGPPSRGGPAARCTGHR